MLPTNLGLAMIMTAAVAFFPVVDGIPLLPIDPVQILWINLVAAVALALPLVEGFPPHDRPRQRVDSVPLLQQLHQPQRSLKFMPTDFNQIDRAIAVFMRRYGVAALRISLAVIFVWFGILKPMGISAAQPLVERTVDWMPLLSAGQWVSVIGFWEVAIGAAFLFPATTRLAIALLALQMVGTFMPLVVLPDVAFQPGRIPYAPTIEGQYIIKNLLIISAALVIGGTVREDTPPGGERTA